MSKTNFWSAIESQIDAGAYPAVFITADGKLGLDGTANGAVLPKRLAAKMPAAVIEQARAKQAERAAEAAKASADRAEQYRREQAELRAKIHATGARLVWGLCGFYLEEMTGAMASWLEVDRFSAWAGAQDFKGPTELFAAAYDEAGNETLRIPLHRFFDLAGVRDRHQRFDFSAIVKKFQAHLAEQRSRQAAIN